MFTLKKFVKIYNLLIFRGLRAPQYVVTIYKYVDLMRFDPLFTAQQSDFVYDF